MSEKSTLERLAILLALIILVAIAILGCSLHYHQQADSQDLDVEILRPAPIQQPNTG